MATADMTIIMVIMLVNIADAKAKLSELVEAATRGEQVIICNRNEPVAELRALEAAKTPRDLTPIYPDWTIDPAFFDPLDEKDLDVWYGGPDARARRVSGSRTTYSSRRSTRRRRK
jgi:antitoxin (DNA-binding transcriptional repressor) of toxin-antitoxin stability system